MLFTKEIFMNERLKFIKKLPTPIELQELFPINATLSHIKEQRDKQLQNILTGKDSRLLLIIGPCSADNETSVLDYMTRLSQIREEVSDKIFIIPRVYTNKPRTIGTGYKGMLHQPNLEKKENLIAGIIAVRELNTRIIKETGFTCADEILYPETYLYLSDVLSYATIGARSVEDQLHRMIASGVNIPVGMKNPTSGDLSVLLNSISAAQHKQQFLFRGWEVATTGNPFAHAILRGYVDKFGNDSPNYHCEHLQRLMHSYQKRKLQNPTVIVDCNHANSNKKYLEQIRIAKDVLLSRRESTGLSQLIKGLMIESYIEDGCQPTHGSVYGKSITDPCLGWNKTKELIYTLREELDL